uniref:NADH-ubiquinone oxidoreductase chain 3 n=1 Tax=Elaphrothrips spiniceps TaxID=3003602 RepID=A0AA50LUV9_9NEOP|nr:NADH dehydrogenase subunit 3 [Elaphrothrips spiniceps]
MLCFLLLTLFISFFLFFFSYFISTKKKNDFEKMSPFECGFNMFNYPRNPFSLRFFLISIIFLIFDIEIILFFPILLSLDIYNFIYWVLTIFFFCLVLLWGLFHEWYLGSLSWI